MCFSFDFGVSWQALFLPQRNLCRCFNFSSHCLKRNDVDFHVWHQHFPLFPLREITKFVLFLCLCHSGGHLAAGARFRAVEDPAGDRRLDSSSSGLAAETRGDREPAQCNATCCTHTHTCSCDEDKLMSQIRG